MTIQEMYQALKVKVEEARKLNKQNMSEEEIAAYTKVMNDVRKLQADIKNEEELRGIEDQINNPQNKRQSAPNADPAPGGEEKRFASLGEQLIAVARADTGRGIDKRLIESRASGLNEAIPSEGGFLIQQEFVPGLIKKAYENGAVANRARRFPVGAGSNGIKIRTIDETSRANGSRFGGVQAYWENEADTPTATKPKFGLMTLNLEKLMALCYATDENLEDATFLGALIEQSFAEEMAFKLDDALINGNGAGKPLGILSSNALVSVAKETNQTADTIVLNNIIKMWSRMWARSRANAVWYINQDIEPQLYTMTISAGTGGMPVYMPAGGISGAPYGTLFGRPVIPIEQAATVGDAGDIILADMNQYLMIDKGGVQTASSIHVKFIYAENTFRFIYRCNGQPMWDNVLTPFKGTNTLSPFVALAARA